MTTLIHLAAAAMFATASPISDPSGYVFAPFSTNVPAASWISGENQWPLPGVRVIRAEDIAFIDEAFGERYGFLAGRYSNSVNTVKSLSFLPRGTVTFRGLNWLNGNWHMLPMYCDPDASLPSATFLTPAGGEITNFYETVGPPETNIVTTVITNYHTSSTNTYRADWPPIVIPVITNIVVTNIVNPTITTNQILGKTLVDWLLKTGEKDMVASNILYGVNATISAIPSYAEMTNLYTAAARCGRAAFSSSAVDFPFSVKRVEEFDLRYNSYTWVTNGQWRETSYSTNGTINGYTATEIGHSSYTLSLRLNRQVHQGTGEESPDQRYREENLYYNPESEPVKFRLIPFDPPDARQGRIDDIVLFVRYRISVYESVYEGATEVYNFYTNLYPVCRYECTKDSRTNSLFTVNGPLGEVELAQRYGRPLVSTGYPEMWQSRTVSIFSYIQEAIAIVTPIFQTTATQ